MICSNEDGQRIVIYCTAGRLMGTLPFGFYRGIIYTT